MGDTEQERNSCSAETTAQSRGRTLTPKTTTEKLPWSDGTYARPVTPGMFAPLGDDEVPLRSIPAAQSVPSHLLGRYTNQDRTVRTIGSTPVLRAKSPVNAAGRRVSSTGAGGHTSVPRNRVSRISGHSDIEKSSSRSQEGIFAGKTPLPGRGGGPSTRHTAKINRTNSTKLEVPRDETRRRKSSLTPVPPHLEAQSSTSDSIQSPPEDNTYQTSPPSVVPLDGTRRRKSSLTPVPPHLEARSSTPNTIQRPTRRNTYVASQPAITMSAQLSPSQPVPRRNPFESARDKRRISNAIEGLEDLVQEAIDIAQDNTDRGQVQEVYEIIENATDAIRKASIPARHLMATTSPLEVSESSEDVSESSLSSENYHSPDERKTTTTRVPIQRGVFDQRVVAVPVELDRDRGSRSIDWAYTDNKARKPKLSFSSSSSSHDSSEQRPSKLSNGSDFLLPPTQAQTAPREYKEFVLRPARDPERPPRRRATDVGPDVRRQRRHRSPKRNADSSSSDEEENIRPRHRSRRKRYRNVLSVREQAHQHTFSLRKHRHRQPIARNWSTGKKRVTAAVACLNTALLGIIVGIYAGEVPRIQYMLADEQHHSIVGNVVLYFGLAISTFVSWPLPLLHGRKPYILASLALALPLQFPQAIVVGARRSPKDAIYRTGLLVARAFSGLVLGFANVNFITILLDLFGASLQSRNPHQEFVVVNDVRRHGGGMGMWLGIWSWCAIGSLAVGFQIGAGIIENHTPDWGFYIVIIILAAALVINVLAPETRRATYRKSVTEVYDRDENFITRRVARGEIKLHVGTEGPKYWFEEVWAGMKLSIMMCLQPGFAVLAFYLGWIYAQIVLVIVLLGALLSRDYKWYPRYVGLGVMSIAIGALLAIPLTKAGIFSRDRKRPFRTDSMTFQERVSWTSHLARRIIFTLTLPLMGLAYTVSSAGRPQPYMVPIVFSGAVGFLSILAIAECHGLIMETFDTCDLQPGVNTRHRLQSMAVQDRRRRTNYSSFPRVTAGIFASQTLAFIGAAVATEVGGIMTRRIGAQASTGVTAGILLGLTVLLLAVLWRFREVQVIPNHTFGTRRDTKAWEEFKEIGKNDWKAVVIGNPSGKMRRMSVLELGGLSRWTEIRKLNYLIREGKESGSSWGR